jgi:hypothetical protein
VVVTIAILVGGLIYINVWTALSHRGWVSVSDMWNSAEISLALSHGHFSALYAKSSQVISPPGLEVLLAPFMALGHALGLRTPQKGLARSDSLWIILFPAALIAASSALFALDAVARSWLVSEGKRMALSVVAGLGVLSAVVYWGHPEDCIALGLVLWAALLIEREGVAGTSRAGWLLGLAVAFQPLALLGVAPIMARFTWRALPRLSYRLALPSIGLVLPSFLTSPRQTLHSLILQPFFPPAVSSTPFSNLAPSVGHGLHSGGPMRLGATVAAVALGYLICRRRYDLSTVLLVIAMAFLIRVIFETEVLGFYFFPVTAICLLLAVRMSWPRLWLCATASVICLILGNRREHSIVLWWPAIMAITLLAVVAVAVPVLSERRSGDRVLLPGGVRGAATRHPISGAIGAGSRH